MADPPPEKRVVERRHVAASAEKRCPEIHDHRRADTDHDGVAWPISTAGETSAFGSTAEVLRHRRNETASGAGRRNYSAKGADWIRRENPSPMCPAMWERGFRLTSCSRTSEKAFLNP